MSDFQLFMPLAKADKKKRMVYGYATTPTMDLDGEVIEMAAVKAALPDYMKWANIREMHTSSAVGVTKEAEIDENGLWIGAYVSDDAAWKKIEDEVYKGFSIGGRVVQKVGKSIKEMKLIEISLVDRPCNPDCKIEVVKAAALDQVEKGTVALVPLEDARQPDIAEQIGEFFKGLFAKRDVVIPTMPPEPRATVSPIHPSAQKPKGDKEADHIVPDPKIPAVDIKELHQVPEGDAGKTEYADHGFQKDRKPRFPIDTEENIRASWVEVQKPGIRKQYDENQLAHIESKISDAWKKRIDVEGPDAGKTSKSAIESLLTIIKSGEPAQQVQAATVLLGLAGFKEANVTADDLLTPLVFEKRVAEPDLLDNDAFAKCMSGVADLAYTFSSLRRLQRQMIVEGKVEDDPRDAAMAAKAGSLAQQVAALIVEMAEEEASEAATLTDIRDLNFRDYETGVTLEMGTNELDFTKSAQDPIDRVKGAGRAIAKAVGATKSLADILVKIHAAHADVVKKGAGAVDSKAIVKMLHDAAGEVAELNDQHNTANDSLEKAASVIAGWSVGGSVSTVSQSSMTEGTPAWYDATKPYPGKQAGATIDGTYTEEQVQKMLKEREELAALRAENEVLKRQPLVVPGKVHPLSFDIGKAAAGTSVSTGEAPKNEMQLLTDGLGQVTDDPESRTKAAGRMIGNMIKNAATFGKNPNSDPNFRGGAGGNR